ncbi:MAG: hypothetical protein ACR2HH_14550 [Chthoniobacterales bacterium]
MTFRVVHLGLLAVVPIAAAVAGVLKLPQGSIVVPSSISPDHHYGVTAFDTTTGNPLPPEIDYNRIADLRAGRLLGPIKSSAVTTHGGDIFPARWSSDESLLVWEVDGKWSPRVLVLIQIRGSTILSQVDILTVAQQAILARTRKAAPERFAAAKAANRGSGSAYPEGFTIDVEAFDPVSFPLRVRAILTSNPKDLEGFPNLRSYLDGVVDSQGAFRRDTFSTWVTPIAALLVNATSTPNQAMQPTATVPMRRFHCFMNATCKSRGG